MRKIRLALGLAMASALAMGATVAPALAANKPVSVTAVKVAKAPTIDGVLDDQAWLEAAYAGSKVSGFSTHDGSAIASDQTIVFISYDDKNLYLAYKNHRSDMSALVATMTDEGSAVWGEDDNELFIDPANDEASFVQFAWNALGTRWTGVGTYDGWTVKTSKDKAAWYAEVSVPWELLGVDPKEGTTIGMNVTGHVIWNDQWTAWSTTFGTFLNAARFGDLILGPAWVAE